MTSKIAPPNENTLRLLVASDNHLGFMEDDPIRGDDSFKSFEEILQKARDNSVDFVLLGGDLFHDNKPSRKTIHRTMELLREYCLGDRPVKVNVLSDQSLNFSSKFKKVNYEDPNFNIAMPIFTIHGNHDDPAGSGALSALDLLSVANFVNYFGKAASVDNIELYPILFEKGTTRVALYGLGNVRDERLYRTFEQRRVKMMRPLEDRESWFNILVLHQNRAAHSPKNYVHEEFLDEWLDMIIWGHEHECQITPTPSAIGQFFISQPGSSVATSLSEGEAVAKHCGILEIQGDKFRLRAIPLETVRPLSLATLNLSDAAVHVNDAEGVEAFLAAKVNDMIDAAVGAAANTRAPLPPLIRLKVDFSGGFATIAPARFGQRFVGRVANADDILLYFKRKGIISTDEMPLLECLRGEAGVQTDVEQLMAKLIDESKYNSLVLSDLSFTQALKAFVDKDDKEAIENFVKDMLEQQCANVHKCASCQAPEIDEIRIILAAAGATQNAAEKRREAERNMTNEERDALAKQQQATSSSRSVSNAAAAAADGIVCRRIVVAYNTDTSTSTEVAEVKKEAPKAKRESKARKPAAKRATKSKVNDADDNDDDDDGDAVPVKRESEKKAIVLSDDEDDAPKRRKKAKVEPKTEAKPKVEPQPKVRDIQERYID